MFNFFLKFHSVSYWKDYFYLPIFTGKFPFFDYFYQSLPYILNNFMSFANFLNAKTGIELIYNISIQFLNMNKKKNILFHLVCE